MEEGESPTEAGARELLEETSYGDTTRLTLIASLSPNTSTHGCPAAIRNPYHQRRNAIMRGDYGVIREQDVRPWPGKADKDQARNDGGENEPAKDLERGKEMRIEIGRRHGSVANSRKGLK